MTEVAQVLQLRLAVEVEAAGLAAAHRTHEDLAAMVGHRAAIDTAVAAGENAVQSDSAFHRAISTGTGNPYFERFTHVLGPVVIPRQSIRPAAEPVDQRRADLAHVQAEHRRIGRGSVEAARVAVREHLEASRDHHARMSARSQGP